MIGTSFEANEGDKKTGTISTIYLDNFISFLL